MTSTTRLEAVARTTSHHLITCTPPEDDPTWVITDATDIVFVAVRSHDDDSEVLRASMIGGDITPTGDYTAKLVIAHDMWPAGDLPTYLVWGLMGYAATGPRQLAQGDMKVREPIPDD